MYIIPIYIGLGILGIPVIYNKLYIGIDDIDTLCTALLVFCCRVYFDFYSNIILDLVIFSSNLKLIKEELCTAYR